MSVHKILSSYGTADTEFHSCLKCQGRLSLCGVLPIQGEIHSPYSPRLEVVSICSDVHRVFLCIHIARLLLQRPV